jgi:chromosome segregation ATPase
MSVLDGAFWTWPLGAVLLGLFTGWLLWGRRKGEAEAAPDQEVLQGRAGSVERWEEELARVKDFWSAKQEAWNRERQVGEEELRKRDAEIEALHFDLARLRARAREWDGLSETHEHTVSELRRIIVRKEDELSSVHASVELFRRRLDDCDRRNLEQEATLTLLESRLQSSLADSDVAEQRVKSRHRAAHHDGAPR